MSDTENPSTAVDVYSSPVLGGYLGSVFLQLQRELTSPEVRMFEDYLKMAAELWLRHMVA